MARFDRLDIQPGPELVALDEQGQRRRLHPIWLRERSSDPASLDRASGQRLVNSSALPLDLAIVEASWTEQETIRIRFSDGCESEYRPADLLAEFGWSEKGFLHPGLALWDSSLIDGLPTVAYEELAGERELHGMLAAFFRHGFVRIRNVPCTVEASMELGQRLGFVRTTNFGQTFDVVTRPEATELAYTSVELLAHTDGSYRYMSPGIQVLHAFANDCDGGETILVDGFAVAETLRGEAPEDFDTLAGTTLHYNYFDEETVLRNWDRTIKVNADDDVVKIVFRRNVDFVPPMPCERLDAFYRARQRFAGLIDSGRFEVRFRLDAGDMIIFNNERVLHGRTAFGETISRRHLHGYYIDLEGPLSRYWVLRDRFGA